MITTTEKREIGLRRRVYARWVLDGRITRAKADREIAVMEAILADYEALVSKEMLL